MQAAGLTAVPAPSRPPTLATPLSPRSVAKMGGSKHRRGLTGTQVGSMKVRQSASALF